MIRKCAKCSCVLGPWDYAYCEDCRQELIAEKRKYKNQWNKEIIEV